MPTAGRLVARPQKRRDESPPAGIPEDLIFRGYGLSPVSGSPVERFAVPPPDRSTPDAIEDLDAIMATIELATAALRINIDELRARVALIRDR